MIFYDTNALLELQGEAFTHSFVISQKTLEEIENIKSSGTKSQETRYKARKLAHLLDDNESMFDVIFAHQEVYNTIEQYGLTPTPDNIICASAKYLQNEGNDITFVSDDINCKNIARRLFDLATTGVSTDESIYKGYKLLRGNTAQINEEMFDKNFTNRFVTNEYLLIYNEDTDEEREMRFDGEKFVDLKLPSSKIIKGRNALQRCALDALANKDITIVAVIGLSGSGKTCLATRMALYSVRDKGYQSKIVGIREPIGEGQDVGYLQGSFEDKTDNFFAPLVDQLQGGEFELASLKQQGMLEATIPFYMKGRSYNESILLCDEAEDLNMKQIRLVGTRVGENSRIFFVGDYKQSVKDSTRNNALLEMCNAFKGNPKFACVCLNEDVRSDSSKMFADILKS